MTEIQTSLPTAQPTTPQQSAAQSSVAGDALTSDFETFLLMLTTQLQNQDPLNPIESQDFAVQLATFSGVEQQVRTNELLENLASGLGASGLSQLADWVGMEARVAAPVVVNGAPIDIALSPDPGSDRAELVVTDSFGREVARTDVPLGIETISWAPTYSDGRPLPPGTYDLSLASINQGVVTSTSPVAHYATITEARQGPAGIDLVFAGGAVISSDAVTALRRPNGP